MLLVIQFKYVSLKEGKQPLVKTTYNNGRISAERHLNFEIIGRKKPKKNPNWIVKRCDEIPKAKIFFTTYFDISEGP